jgi:hypothetical protein
MAQKKTKMSSNSFSKNLDHAEEMDDLSRILLRV